MEYLIFLVIMGGLFCYAKLYDLKSNKTHERNKASQNHKLINYIFPAKERRIQQKSAMVLSHSPNYAAPTEQKQAGKKDKVIYFKSHADKQCAQNNGIVVIPKGFNEISFGAFDKNENVTSITVPSSIIKIEGRAFADCKNLKEVNLAEGLETIEGNAFTDCASLEELIIPDSITYLYGWAFYNFTGLKYPAYNRSGDILYCYPCTAREKTFTVPDRVKKINSAAFIGNPYIEEIVFPTGLEAVGINIFIDCTALKKVTIPGENTVIPIDAFHSAPDSLEIVMPKKPRYDEYLHWRGKSFLVNVCQSVSDLSYENKKLFMELAKNCTYGSAKDMWELGELFSRAGKNEFYECAANFWRYRAAAKNYGPAIAWLEEWLQNNPNKRMPSILNEYLSGFVNGEILYQAGLLSFDTNTEYSLKSPDENGIVVAASYVGEEGPDEDGFGRESLFDWWFFDENLNLIQEASAIRSHSARDCSYSAIYKQEYEKAVSAVKNKKSSNKVSV